MELRNETAVNVATLLQDEIGSRRTYALRLDSFALDRDLSADDVSGTFKLVRLRDEILAKVDVAGTVSLQCQRCLGEYRQPVATSFDEEFRQSVDVKNGAGLPEDVEDERFTIDENHELDIAEPLRQEILVALPMRPTCGPDCPGPEKLEFGNEDDHDDRFAELAKLLERERG